MWDQWAELKPEVWEGTVWLGQVPPVLGERKARKPDVMTVEHLLRRGQRMRRLRDGWQRHQACRWYWRDDREAPRYLRRQRRWKA